ncbi:MAG: hypothetical protein KDB54_07085 [Solirubrobacterales bacterium]|nr:hypothetical protein [Solirubrobacterales bacterium]MCB0860402.1 hypothetical protein [Solirubrobacterales bacterium]HRV60122.1 hypothetical protein [Solirubrobacterales bacterium]
MPGSLKKAPLLLSGIALFLVGLTGFAAGFWVVGSEIINPDPEADGCGGLMVAVLLYLLTGCAFAGLGAVLMRSSGAGFMTRIPLIGRASPTGLGITAGVAGFTLLAIALFLDYIVSAGSGS